MKILKDFVIRPRKVILGHKMMLKSSGRYSGFSQKCFHIIFIIYEWSVPKNPPKLKYGNWKVIICYLTFKNNLIMTKNHDIGISYFCKSDRVCFESWIKVWYLCYWLTYGHKSMYSYCMMYTELIRFEYLSIILSWYQVIFQ